MSKVVFICLLSISLCYSSPTVKDEKPMPPAAAAPTDPKTSVPAKVEWPLSAPHEVANITTNPAHTEALPVTTPVTTTTTTKNTTENTITPATTSNNTTADNKDKTKKDNITEKTPSTEATPKPDATTTTVKPDQKPTTKPAQDVTTSKAVTTVKPTDAPHPDGKHEPTVVQARGFDGASFVGGMILTLGLLAVGFIGFKYYKNHSERNYHTL